MSVRSYTFGGGGSKNADGSLRNLAAYCADYRKIERGDPWQFRQLKNARNTSATPSIA